MNPFRYDQTPLMISIFNFLIICILQGAIQGPGEFAEGVIIGVRSLVGHAVGGAAGAVSRIAGAMGHGLAALSLDEDYQRKRRDNINKPAANLQEGIARSGKGLFMVSLYK